MLKKGVLFFVLIVPFAGTLPQVIEQSLFLLLFSPTRHFTHIFFSFRLANYVSAATVGFGLAVSLFYSAESEEEEGEIDGERRRGVHGYFQVSEKILANI